MKCRSADIGKIVLVTLGEGVLVSLETGQTARIGDCSRVS